MGGLNSDGFMICSIGILASSITLGRILGRFDNKFVELFRVLSFLCVTLTVDGLRVGRKNTKFLFLFGVKNLCLPIFVVS